MSATDPVREWGTEFDDVIAVVQSRAISIEDAWAVLAAARPAIEREAKAAAVESLREFARAQDTWCDAGRAEQVITRRAMRDALLREADRIEAGQ